MSKYKSQPTIADGHRFPSKKEAARYFQLKMLEKAGQIEGLTLQPRFPIHINGFPVFSYVADFTYNEKGVRVVEDCKGFRTEVYRLKRKCFEAAYGIKIRET